jgi:hypothetical protein
MNVLINKIDNKVIGVDIASTPLSYEIKLDDLIKVEKEISVVDGLKQKEDFDGNKLYKKPVTIKTPYTVVVGQIETTLKTGNTPIFVGVQKVNEQGEPLFYNINGDETTESTYEIHIPLELSENTQKVLDEEGNVVEELPLYKLPVGFSFAEVLESERVETIFLQPVMISVQRANDEGKLLYLKNITETREQIEETFEEVAFEKEAIAWETQEIPNMVLVEEEIDGFDEEGNSIKIKTGNMIEVQDGIKEIQVETDWNVYEPIMINNVITKVISLQDTPSEFTALEILEAKYGDALEKSDCNYLIADGLINCNDIDLNDIQANTGVNTLVLLPNGYAKTAEIVLEESCKLFKILELDVEEGVDVFVNDVKFVDGQAIVSNELNKVVIKFVNTTDKFKSVNSYAIGY